MLSRKVCFLDCDGVIADFIGGCCKLLNTTPEEAFEDLTPPYSFSLEKMFGEEKAKQLFDSMDVEFWANLDKLPWADELVEMVSKIFDDRVYLCTSAGYLGSSSYFSNAVAGKEKWIIKHFPQFAKKTIFAFDKSCFASENSTLIDDSQTAVNGFVSYGGTGVLFPAKWNSGWGHASDPITYLKLLFKYED